MQLTCAKVLHAQERLRKFNVKVYKHSLWYLWRGPNIKQSRSAQQPGG